MPISTIGAQAITAGRLQNSYVKANRAVYQSRYEHAITKLRDGIGPEAARIEPHRLRAGLRELANLGAAETGRLPEEHARTRQGMYDAMKEARQAVTGGGAGQPACAFTEAQQTALLALARDPAFADSLTVDEAKELAYFFPRARLEETYRLKLQALAGLLGRCSGAPAASDLQQAQKQVCHAVQAMTTRRSGTGQPDLRMVSREVLDRLPPDQLHTIKQHLLRAQASSAFEPVRACLVDAACEALALWATLRVLSGPVTPDEITAARHRGKQADGAATAPVPAGAAEAAPVTSQLPQTSIRIEPSPADASLDGISTPDAPLDDTALNTSLREVIAVCVERLAQWFRELTLALSGHSMMVPTPAHPAGDVRQALSPAVRDCLTLIYPIEPTCAFALQQAGKQIAQLDLQAAAVTFDGPTEVETRWKVLPGTVVGKAAIEALGGVQWQSAPAAILATYRAELAGRMLIPVDKHLADPRLSQGFVGDMARYRPSVMKGETRITVAGDAFRFTDGSDLLQAQRLMKMIVEKLDLRREANRPALFPLAPGAADNVDEQLLEQLQRVDQRLLGGFPAAFDQWLPEVAKEDLSYFDHLVQLSSAQAYGGAAALPMQTEWAFTGSGRNDGSFHLIVSQFCHHIPRIGDPTNRATATELQQGNLGVMAIYRISRNGIEIADFKVTGKIVRHPAGETHAQASIWRQHVLARLRPDLVPAAVESASSQEGQASPPPAMTAANAAVSPAARQALFGGGLPPAGAGDPVLRMPRADGKSRARTNMDTSSVLDGMDLAGVRLKDMLSGNVDLKGRSLKGVTLKQLVGRGVNVYFTPYTKLMDHGISLAGTTLADLGKFVIPCHNPVPETVVRHMGKNGLLQGARLAEPAALPGNQNLRRTLLQHVRISTLLGYGVDLEGTTLKQLEAEAIIIDISASELARAGIRPEPEQNAMGDGTRAPGASGTGRGRETVLEKV